MALRYETGGRPPPIDRAIFACGEAVDAGDTLFLMAHQLEHGVSGLTKVRILSITSLTPTGYHRLGLQVETP